jgi:hypothetical protein
MRAGGEGEGVAIGDELVDETKAGAALWQG